MNKDSYQQGELFTNRLLYVSSKPDNGFFQGLVYDPLRVQDEGSLGHKIYTEFQKTEEIIRTVPVYTQNTPTGLIFMLNSNFLINKIESQSEIVINFKARSKVMNTMLDDILANPQAYVKPQTQLFF